MQICWLQCFWLPSLLEVWEGVGTLEKVLVISAQICHHCRDQWLNDEPESLMKWPLWVVGAASKSFAVLACPILLRLPFIQQRKTVVLQRPKVSRAHCCKAHRGLWGQTAGWSLMSTGGCQHVATTYPGQKEKGEVEAKYTCILPRIWNLPLLPRIFWEIGRDGWKFTGQTCPGEALYNKEKKNRIDEMQAASPSIFYLQPLASQEALPWSL